MAMGRRLLPLISAGEQDALTSWRRVYAYLTRAGATSGIKRQYRRRERHAARQAIRDADQ